MAKTTREQAKDLAQVFRELSNELGDYRFENWGMLTASQRQQIENTEWTLLNHSSDFITTAVGIGLDDVTKDLAAISAATASAKKVIKTINSVKSILAISADLLVLAGAVASQNPGSILTATEGLATTSSNALKNV